MSPALSRPRKFVWGLLIAIVLTAGLLLALEGLLRLAGIGYSARFHRTERDERGEVWIRENRWVTAPYFSRDRVRRPLPFRLRAEKPASAFRIFVLGSSAAMGDPEPSFSIARVLEELLDEAYPEVEFQVVNAGITAVNSHVVRHIAEDVAELSPDLFIVYEGHNEVIGPFGPGTVFTPFFRSPHAIRLMDTLQRTRLGQVTRSIFRGSSDAGEWGGMAMFLGQEISFDDPRLDLVRDAFRANLEAIADAAADVGATTFLCTVLTNQRDFAPFLSRHRAGLDAAQLAEWETCVQAGDAEVAAGRVQAAEEQYRRALAIDDQHAELVFRLARLVLGQRRLDEARTLFQRALDLDALRFRTDSSLNGIIRGLEGEGIQIVDLEAVAADASAGGIIGEEFLLEHVHLNFAGTYLVARTLFDRVGELLEAQGRVAAARSEALPVDEVRSRLGYTAYEQALIIRELIDRYSKPPFTGQADHAQRMQAMRVADTTASRLLNRPEAPAALAQMYADAVGRDPGDWILCRNAGMALVALGDPTQAIDYLERARQIIPDDPPTLFSLGLAYQKTAHDSEAADAFDALHALEPDYPGLAARATDD